jgi:hypothetical protein
MTLYRYTESAAAVLASDQITVPVAFRGYNSILNFTLATFSSNGSFLGFSALSTQLHMCAGQLADLTKFLQVGHSADVSCSISLGAMASKDGLAYELFVNDVNGLMYPVPVVVTTLRSGTAQPNQQFIKDGASTSTVLTRRFFLADTQSGQASDSKQSVVQYRPPSPLITNRLLVLNMTLQVRVEDCAAHINPNLQAYFNLPPRPHRHVLLLLLRSISGLSRLFFFRVHHGHLGVF